MLFDFFGTLTTAVRRGAAHAPIVRSLGCEPASFAAALDRTFYERASGDYGTPFDALARIAGELGAAPSRAALTAAVGARVAAVAADTRLRADAVPALAALRRRGLRTALVSDCWYELPRFLPALPVAPLLDVCVYSVQVGRCKPDPSMYLAACARLGVSPTDCLYVGDGGSQELTGARAVGMTAVRLSAPDLAGHLTFNADRHWSGADVTSLTEVVEMAGRTPAPV
ncbi:MAG TPA: HAD family hydrolase [Micromonosporaceae bacterium]|nr:HAD family hydrolase [Micromonosporaceae bacterium]